MAILNLQDFSFTCNIMQVSTNGYFSMGEFPKFNDVPNFPLPDNGMIVAPFGADIDTTITGSVLYTSNLGILDSSERR